MRDGRTDGERDHYLEEETEDLTPAFGFEVEVVERGYASDHLVCLGGLADLCGCWHDGSRLLSEVE